MSFDDRVARCFFTEEIYFVGENGWILDVNLFNESTSEQLTLTAKWFRFKVYYLMGSKWIFLFYFSFYFYFLDFSRFYLFASMIFFLMLNLWLIFWDFTVLILENVDIWLKIGLMNEKLLFLLVFFNV